MKKRHLRKNVERTLIIITSFLFIFVASIDDYEISFLPVYIGLWTVVVINIYILKKYGKGE